jgi:hypothetical protein
MVVGADATPGERLESEAKSARRTEGLDVL